MSKFKARRGPKEFLYGGLGRPELTNKNGWVDGQTQMDGGTPIAIDTATGNLVPYDASSAVAGHNAFSGFLLEHVDVDPFGSVESWPVSYIAHGPQAISTSFGRVPLLNTTTMDQIHAAAEAKGFTVMD